MDENNAVTSFLNGISESKELFNETPVETVLEDKEEKAIPFHKDPKVQRYVEKQISKALESVKPAIAHREEVASSDVKDLVGAFTALIGNDTPEKVEALEKLEKTLNGSDERAVQKAIERFQSQQQELVKKQADAEKKAQEELENYFDEIEETYNVDLSSNSASAKATRSQFVEYVRKIAPKDVNGEVSAFPDLISAFEEFQEKSKRPSATRAKELANRGLTRSGDTTTTIPQGNSWKDVDRFFEKLKANQN